MRLKILSFALPVILFATACGDGDPLQPQTVQAPQLAAVAGTGNPETDAQLAALNNQIVACVQSGELEYRRASTLALFTAILRYTPSSSSKVAALLQALALQIQHAQRQGEISDACAQRLSSMAESIAT